MNLLLLTSCLYNVHIHNTPHIKKEHFVCSKIQSGIIFCCEVNKLRDCKVICV